MAIKIEQRFLDRIKKLQTEYSHEGLTKPKDKTEFGFGEACGTYCGLILAEQLFLEVVGEGNE